MAAFNHNVNPQAYVDALKWEYASARTNEHKAAIIAELESLGIRTNVQNRTDVESAAAPAVPQESAAEAESRGRHAGEH